MKKLVNNLVNPLRVDPTCTTTLRTRFIRSLSVPFRKLKGEILKLVNKQDVFGIRSGLGVRNESTIPVLGDNSSISDSGKNDNSAHDRLGREKQSTGRFKTHLVGNQRFAFMSDPQKLDAFEDWLRTQVDSIGLTDEQLYEQFAKEGFEKGGMRSFDDVKIVDKLNQGEAVFDQSRVEFFRSAFGRPESVDKIKILASRTLSDIKGVTEVMASGMRRVLADGLARGDNPLTIARSMNKTVDVGIRKARTIARTEIIRAHAQGQLHALEQLGVKQVGVMLEWSTAGDACKLCAPLSGMVVKIKEAQNMIPRHPNCRCAWIPANVGEFAKGQIRGRKNIRSAIIKSAKAETGKKSSKKALEKSVWVGADVKPSKKRPKGLIQVAKRKFKRTRG